MKRRYLIIGAIIILLVAAGVFYSRNSAFAAPEQPVQFRHRNHARKSIQCLYCHASAARSEIAGIPSMQKCAGCHNYMTKNRESVQVVMGYWERGEAIPWQRVNRQPDFVYFSHQPHVLAGVSCETCHGDVANMDETRAVVNMDMGWCLDCHLEQPEADRARLIDCIACHK